MSWSDDYHKLVEEDRKKKKKREESPEPFEQKAEAEKKSEAANKVFTKGAFEDGYQFGDILRTTEGTLMDIRENAITGVLGIGEGLLNFGSTVVGGVGKLFGADDFADDVADFVAKDKINEEKIAKAIVNGTSGVFRMTAGDDADEISVLGEKADSFVQSGGQLLGAAVTGPFATAVIGATAFGDEAANAFQNGATYGEAVLSATITAGAEMLTEKISGGIKFGGKALDDAATKWLARNVSNKAVRLGAQMGLDFLGEGGEEVLSGVLSALGQKLTYASDKELSELFTSEEALESFISGGLLGFGSSGVKAGINVANGKDAVSGLTKNEEAVVKKLYDDAVKEAEKSGKVSETEKNEIYDEIVEQMEKGYISTDTIEEVLGGDTYQSYRDTVDNEDALVKEYDTLGDLKESELTVKQRKRLNELEAQIAEFQKADKRNQLKTKLGEEVFSLVENDRLSESYAEKSRRGQAFAADLSKYDAKQRQTIRRAIDSGILNDTNRTHEFVDFVAKLSADKGVPFDFTNNAKLKETGFALDGVTVNGFVNESGVTVNVNSAKALNAVVGHEITHVLEGTELYDSLKTAITEYAKSKGDYDSRLAQLTKLYEGRNANIEQEVVADLVGDYLFTNKDFVKRLCTEHRNVFQKIYDEIKYLCKVVTAGSKEARQLERVKKAFEEAYRQDAKKPTRDGGVRYSLSSIVGASGKNYGVGVYLDSTLLSNLTEDERIDMVKEYIKELGGSVFTAYDNNGNAVDIHIVESSKKFKNKSGKRVSVNKDLMYRLKNEVKQEAIALVDELVQASTYHGKEPATHPHDWVDDNGANDWDLWKTYIQDKQNTIWEASLRIANSANGDKILYDIFPIKMVEGAGTAATTTTNNNIAQTPPTVNTPNSLSEQGADDIAPMPWQIRGKDVALDDIAHVKETLEAESAGQTKSPVSQAEDAVATPREFISLEDYANNESPVWRNVGYADEETKAAITQETHDRMVSSGAVVTVAGDVMDKVEKSFPDLRGMKKTERTPILKEAINKLKSNIRQFLTGLSNQNFEFEVNGKVLEAKLYSTGINEVLEKVTKEKANMLYSTEGIFQNAQYLYSAPDYDGDPNVYRWNYFYTPVRIGEDVVGVRIAVRDMVRGTDGATPESQIYNWGIKKNASLDGGSHGPRVASSGVSSDAPNNNIPQNPPNVNPDDSTGAAPAGETATVNQAKTAQILFGEHQTPKQKSAWKWAREHILSHGAVFEDLSLKTGNRELQAKFDNIRRAESRAQNFIGKGKGQKALVNVRKEVEKAGKTEDFNYYLYHLHNVDRMTLEQRFKDVPNKSVFGDSVTAEVSRKAAANLETLNPEFKQWAEDVYAINKHLRQMMVSEGIISQETADLWQTMYPHYVPISRADYKGLNINVPLDTKRTGVNAPIKKAKGGNSDFYNVFDTMGSRIEQTFKAISKNRFGVELKNTLGTAFESEKADIDSVLESMDAHEELLQEGKNGESPTFTVFENGERVKFAITKDMYDAMKPSQFTYTNEVLKKVNNVRRDILTTFSPTFALTNPIKDVQDILLNSQHPAKTYAAIPEAIKSVIMKDHWYQERMENGGDQDTYFDSQKKTFKKEKSKLSKIVGFPFEKIRQANEIIEQVPRMAEYIASRKMGRSVDVSMLDAARVTTNFGAAGDFTNMLNRNGFTFLGASVEGFNQQVRNVREAKAEGAKGWAKLAGKYLAAGLPALLLNHLLWDDDEEYEELSDYVKQNYYVVAKTEDGKFVRIPKGRAVSVIQDAFRQMENMITGNDEADFDSFAQLVVNNLAPNNPLENNIIAPLYQAYSNKTWYGDDLVPTRLQDMPAAEQFDETTDFLSKWLGEATNISPYKWNYLLDQYTGGIGDIALPYLTPAADGGGFGAAFRDKFVTDPVLKNQNVTDFYDKMDELSVNANSMYATDEDVLMSKYMSSVNSELSKLYQQKREIQNGDWSDAKKAAAIRDIQQQIVDLTREGLDSYADVNIEGVYATVGNQQFRRNGPDEGSNAEPSWKKLTAEEIAKQDEATSDFGISPSEYWRCKKEYALPQVVGGYSRYKTYSSELNDIKADKDVNGKTISGSRKKKVVDYINSLDADYGEKIILYKNEYPSDHTYNNDIIDYLNSREDLSYEDMEAILKALGFRVDSQGNVTWG